MIRKTWIEYSVRNSPRIARVIKKEKGRYNGKNKIQNTVHETSDGETPRGKRS